MMNRRRGVSGLAVVPVLEVLAALVGLFALDPAPAHAADRLECPSKVSEGTRATAQLNWPPGYQRTAYWTTYSESAGEDDYYPKDDRRQVSSFHERSVGHMRIGMETKEDSLVEGNETFRLGVRGDGFSESCTITIVDDDAPRVADVGIISSPEDGVAYRIGEVVEIDVTFDLPVKTAGEPFVRLRLGSEGDPDNLDGWLDTWQDDPNARTARYRRGSGTNTLSFSYVVWEGDEDPNGITVVSSPVRGMGEGTIKYLSEELDVDAFHNFQGLSNAVTSAYQRVDGRPPQADSVEIVSRPNDGATYRAGERIEVQVAFSHPVQVLGGPAVKLRLGLRGDSPADRSILALPSGDLWLREAAYTEGHPYDTILDFEYVVQPEDDDVNGLTIVGSSTTGLGESAIAFQRFDYTDGRYADIGFPDELILADHSYRRQDNFSGHMVDGRPYVTDVSIVSRPADGTAYRNGDDIKVRVTFNDPVVVLRSREVYVGLELDGPDGPEYRDAHYERLGNKKSSLDLLFKYTVQEGDRDSNGVTILSSKDTGLGGRNIIAAPDGDSEEEIYANTSYAA